MFFQNASPSDRTARIRPKKETGNSFRSERSTALISLKKTASPPSDHLYFGDLTECHMPPFRRTKFNDGESKMK
jgi:hypothetical protein